MKIFNCRILDPHNIGDGVSNPAYYFPEFDGPEIGIKDLTREHLQEGHVIFGGGGILFKELLWYLDQATQWPRKGKLIFWGSGLNLWDEHPQVYHRFMDRFDLVGCRDWENPWQWVPCVSCMEPMFDLEIEPTESLRFYQHHAYRHVGNGQHSMTNEWSKEHFPKVIQFLKGAKEVATNTYHGVYWTRLCGRKVRRIEGEKSNKMLFFPPDEMLKLGVCRERNVLFAEQVRRIL